MNTEESLRRIPSLRGTNSLLVLMFLVCWPPVPGSAERLTWQYVVENTNGQENGIGKSADVVMYIYTHPRVCRAVLEEHEVWEKAQTEFGDHGLLVVLIVDDMFGADEAIEFAKKYCRSVHWRIDKDGKIRKRLDAIGALMPIKIITDAGGNVLFCDVMCTDKEERELLYKQVRKLMLLIKKRS